MRREVLRTMNLYSMNSCYERLERLSMVIRQGESWLLWSHDHSGHTLTDLLRGDAQIRSGSIFLNSSELTECREEEFQKQKIFYIDTRGSFVRTLDLAENIFILRKNHLKKVLLNQRAIHLRAKEMLERYGLCFDVYGRTEGLSAVDKVLINIVRFADQGAKILVLDNISSICGRQDTEVLLRVLRRVRDDGVALVISDSNPEYFTSMADGVGIMKEGRMIKKIVERNSFLLCEKILSAEKVHIDEEVVAADQISAAAGQEQILLSGGTAETDFQIAITPGEVVYLATDHGTVQEQIWQQLQKADGAIGLWGGGDFRRELFWNLSVRDNVLMPVVKKISKGGFYRSGAGFIIRDREFFGDFDMSDERIVYRDKQILKTIFYRWKLSHPRILVMYNVLSRADAEMKEWIIAHLGELTARNTAVVLLESAADVALKAADRVIIVNGNQRGGARGDTVRTYE